MSRWAAPTRNSICWSGGTFSKASIMEPQIVLTLPLLEGLDGVQKDVEVLWQLHRYHGSGRRNVRQGHVDLRRLMWRYFELLSFRPLSDIEALRTAIDEGRIRGTSNLSWRRRSRPASMTTRQRRPPAKSSSRVSRRRNAGPYRGGVGCKPGRHPGIAHLLKEAGLVSSTSEAFRMIKQAPFASTESGLKTAVPRSRPARRTFTRSASEIRASHPDPEPIKNKGL